MGSRVKITLKITYIAKILWIGTRGSIGVCNKAVAKDDLLSLFTTSRNIANSSQYTFGVFRLPMVPMATNGTNGKINIGTLHENDDCPILKTTITHFCWV